MPTQQTPWRAMREPTGLSLREIARRTGIQPWRLSLIERGVPPEPAEESALRQVLAAVLLIQPEAGK